MVREQIEVGLENFARAVARRSGIAIALCLAVAIGLASRLPTLGMDASVENFLPTDDPARMAYDKFRDQFGREDIIIVAIEPPNVFELAFLRELKRFHEEVEESVPYLDEVQSLVNVRSTYGSGDELIVEDLLEEFPETSEAVDKVRERVMSTPMYLNTVISEDATLTSVVITLQLYSSIGEEQDEEAILAAGAGDWENQGSHEDDPLYLTGAEMFEALAAVGEIIDRYRGDDFKVYVAGSPVIQEAVTGSMQRNMPRFVGLMLLTIALVLFILFRRLSGVLLPLFVVILSLVSTIGAFAGSGLKLSPPTQVLPTFLLSVGTSAAVHILKIFYLRFDAGDTADDAIAFAIRHTGLPVIMTGLTTAGGLLSFLAAGLTPIVHLGIFAPIGILLALAYCLILLPALLHVLPLRRRAVTTSGSGATWLEGAIVRVGDFSVMNPRPIIGATVLVVAVSLAGASRLEFSQDIMSWLASDHPLVRATEVIDEKLKGSITLEMVADTGVENGVKHPDFLHKLDVLSARVLAMRPGEALSVGKTISISDVIKEIHQALNSNAAEFYAIPDDPALASQELLLFENTGSDDLEDVVDSQFQLARFTLKMPYADPLQYNSFIHEVTNEFHEIFDDDVQVVVTGFMGMMGQTMLRVMTGLARSYGLALAIITPLMILLIGNLRGGLISMVPNLTPIIITLGIMGWVGITIDMFTMMIGSIAIGLAVDDTIHFIHGFRRDFAACGDARLAVKKTLETTGRALLVTSIVLASGFLVFVFSDMQNLRYFGALTSFTIISAFIIDILVTPALIVLVTAPLSGAREKA